MNTGSDFDIVTFFGFVEQGGEVQHLRVAPFSYQWRNAINLKIWKVRPSIVGGHGGIRCALSTQEKLFSGVLANRNYG